MAAKTHVGVALDHTSITFVETTGTDFARSFILPHDLFGENPQTGETVSLAAEADLKKTITDALAAHNIKNRNVNVCLPSDDVLSRAFLIPWMQSHEVRNVVQYEVLKYIPFKLDQVAYAYHAQDVVDNDVKRLRIIFAAIENDVLEKYCECFKETRLRIQRIEPAAVSLSRALTARDILKPEQTAGILQVQKDKGSFIIIESGVVQFIKDFKFETKPDESDEDFFNRIKQDIFNELRISVDYYYRQGGSRRIASLIGLDPGLNTDIVSEVGESLGIPAQKISVADITGVDSKDFGLLHAYGAALKDHVKLPLDLDLIPNTPESMGFKKENAAAKINLKQAGVAAGICLALIGLTHVFSSSTLKIQRQHIGELKNSEGKYQTISSENLRIQNKDAQLKLQNYKAIPKKTKSTYFFYRIAELLPQGTWIETANFQYEDPYAIRRNTTRRTRETTDGVLNFSQIQIVLNGFSYASSDQEKLRLVNRTVASLGNDPLLTQKFTSIKLLNATGEQYEGFDVTKFQIRLE